MSGGHFNYSQYRMLEIADEVESYVNGIVIDEVDVYLNELDYNIKRWNSESDKEEYEYVKEHHHGKPNNRNFSEETIKEFKKGVEYLRKAYVYAERIDYLLSGDDGEEEFHKRLQKDLKEIE